MANTKPVTLLEWHRFDEHAPQTWPKERRYVLLQFTENKSRGMPPSVVVGYLRKQSDGPMFITPGCIGIDRQECNVTWWADLGDGFFAPLWAFTNSVEWDKSQSDVLPHRHKEKGNT